MNQETRSLLTEASLFEDDFASCGAELITPAFTKGKKQLTAKEMETTGKIANIRIHVESLV